MIKPTFAEFKGYVDRYHKRVGLRMIYKKFEVPEKDKVNYRKMWDILEAEKDASEEQSTEADDGNSGTPAGQVVCEEPVGFINVEGSVA